MKANAPKKIYLQEPTKVRTEKKYDNDVEYTRTDAFIEKALAYLNGKFYFNNLHYAVENNTFNCMEEMFDDFIEYMKGE